MGFERHQFGEKIIVARGTDLSDFEAVAVGACPEHLLDLPKLDFDVQPRLVVGHCSHKKNPCFFPAIARFGLPEAAVGPNGLDEVDRAVGNLVEFDAKVAFGSRATDAFAHEAVVACEDLDGRASEVGILVVQFHGEGFKPFLELSLLDLL